MAGTQLMRSLARDDIVRELTYTGRVFSGIEAQQYGFATRVVRRSAPRRVRNRAGRSRRKARTRFAPRSACSTPRRSPTAADGLLAESVEQQALIGSPNQLEAVYANMQKRAPRFTDP